MSNIKYTNFCYICNSIIHFNILNKYSRIYDDDIHFLCCKNCINEKKGITLISKNTCKNNYFLEDQDLKNCKYIYFENLCNNIKIYNLDDINKIIINKHGDITNFNKILEKKKKLKKIFKKQKILVLQKISN